MSADPRFVEHMNPPPRRPAGDLFLVVGLLVLLALFAATLVVGWPAA